VGNEKESWQETLNIERKLRVSSYKL
jgi:hypothetical protein